MQTLWTIGYVLGEIPSNMILTRVRPSIWVSFPVSQIQCDVSTDTGLIDTYLGSPLDRTHLMHIEMQYCSTALRYQVPGRVGRSGLLSWYAVLDRLVVSER
jgi:hypothetical protein